MALLSDLFGIQSRGGCSCAGPYGHRLLGIDIETSHEFEREISRGCEGIKPGWVRVNFNYFISEAVFEYILAAVELVAADGWRLLPQYGFDAGDRPLAARRPGRGAAALAWRPDLRRRGALSFTAHRHRETESRLADYLAEARALVATPPAPIAARDRLLVARRRRRTSRRCAGSGFPTRSRATASARCEPLPPYRQRVRIVSRPKSCDADAQADRAHRAARRRGDRVAGGTEQDRAARLDHGDPDERDDDDPADLLGGPWVVDARADDDPGDDRREPDRRPEQERARQP